MWVDLLLVDDNVSVHYRFHLYIDCSKFVFTVIVFMSSDCVILFLIFYFSWLFFLNKKSLIWSDLLFSANCIVFISICSVSRWSWSCCSLLFLIFLLGRVDINDPLKFTLIRFQQIHNVSPIAKSLDQWRLISPMSRPRVLRSLLFINKDSVGMSLFTLVLLNTQLLFIQTDHRTDDKMNFIFVVCVKQGSSRRRS